MTIMGRVMRKFTSIFGVFLGLVAAISSVASAKPSDLIDTTRCKIHIPQITCSVGEMSTYDSAKNLFEYQAAELALPCLPDSPTYAARIEEEFDELPPIAQEAFCYIERILIPKKGFEWGGYADGLLEPVNDPLFKDIEDEGRYISSKLKGFLLYLNVNRFELSERMEEHTTRVFQMTFGVDVRRNGFDQDLPFFKAASEEERPSALRGTLIHEIGHLIDLANYFTGYGCSYTKVTSEYESGVFTTIQDFSSFSWKLNVDGPADDCSSYRLAFQEEFSHLRGFVKDHAKHESAEILSELERSSFASVYAMEHPGEDFAEQFTHYHLGEGTYAELGNQVVYSFDRRENSIFIEKNRFIESLGPETFANMKDRLYHVAF